jgi:hypothetical protein
MINKIKYILAAGAAAAICLAGAFALQNNVIAFIVTMPIAIATTHHPILVVWSPFLITLLGAMICPRKHILSHYGALTCMSWTVIAVLLSVLGHRIGQSNILDTFLLGINYPSLRPLTDWIENDHGLLALMVLWPVGPITLWVIILIQVIVGCNIMEFIRKMGILKHVLTVSAAVAICAIAGTSGKDKAPTFRYQDYLTRLALYTGDLFAGDTLSRSADFGLRGIGTLTMWGYTTKTDNEISADMYKVLDHYRLYYLQMARLEAVRVRLGGKPIFHYRPARSADSQTALKTPLLVKPKTEQSGLEVVDDDGKYINEGTWL